MSNRFQDAATRLASRMQGRASSPCVYSRASQMANIDATNGATKFDKFASEDRTIQEQMRDFLVSVDQMFFDTTPIVPTPSDQITFNGSIFEVMNLADSGCWRWSDRFNVQMRIHTKFVGFAP